jgi:hypothetical protein
MARLGFEPFNFARELAFVLWSTTGARHSAWAAANYLVCTVWDEMEEGPWRALIQEENNNHHGQKQEDQGAEGRTSHHQSMRRAGNGYLAWEMASRRCCLGAALSQNAHPTNGHGRAVARQAQVDVRQARFVWQTMRLG